MTFPVRETIPCLGRGDGQNLGDLELDEGPSGRDFAHVLFNNNDIALIPCPGARSEIRSSSVRFIVGTFRAMKAFARRINITSSLVISMVLLGACGTETSESTTTLGPSSSYVTTTTSVDDPDFFVIIPTTDLSDAMLTSDDLGDDWTRTQREIFTDRLSVPVLDPHEWCSQAVDEVMTMQEAAASTGVVTGLRRNPSRGRSHVVTEQLWSGDGAEDFLVAFGDAVEWCSGRSWSTDEGNKISFRPLVSPDGGLPSAGAEVTIETRGPQGDYFWVTRMIAVRRGKVMMLLREMDVQEMGSDQFWSETQWSWVVKKALLNLDLTLG